MANSFNRIYLGICCICLFGVSTGILVGPIKLSSNKRYITYQLGTSPDNTRLVCNVVPQDEEEVQAVEWTFTNYNEKIVGRYVWNSDSDSDASGLLMDKVRLGHRNGDLEITELSYDLNGFYNCTAKTTDGKSASASRYELILIDTTASHQIEDVEIDPDDRCTVMSTFKVCPIYPEPTVHSGLYSESEGGFVEEVAAIDWRKHEYTNKSVAYSYENVRFKIDENTPLDVTFVNSVGVTKHDGSYIPLVSSSAELFRFAERGCPVLKPKEYQRISYNSEARTCRGEILPDSPPLTAELSCVDGYVPYSRDGSVELICDTETWEWKETEDSMMRKFFECVVDDSSFSISASSALITTSLLLLHYVQH